MSFAPSAVLSASWSRELTCRCRKGMDLDDFVALLLNSDEHISSGVMWDAIDMVVPCGCGCISLQQEVHVSLILDEQLAS